MQLQSGQDSWLETLHSKTQLDHQSIKPWRFVSGQTYPHSTNVTSQLTRTLSTFTRIANFSSIASQLVLSISSLVMRQSCYKIVTSMLDAQTRDRKTWLLPKAELIQIKTLVLLFRSTLELVLLLIYNQYRVVFPHIWDGLGNYIRELWLCNHP